eukprot:3407957-Pleurochrysis_carterae.AAC.8
MGGEVPLVPVSATKRMNLDELRDTLLLQARASGDSRRGVSAATAVAARVTRCGVGDCCIARAADKQTHTVHIALVFSSPSVS